MEELKSSQLRQYIYMNMDDSGVLIKGKSDDPIFVYGGIIFLSKDEVLKLFESYFEIIDFQEIEKDGETALNGVKHWHIYNIIARKK